MHDMENMWDETLPLTPLMERRYSTTDTEPTSPIESELRVSRRHVANKASTQKGSPLVMHITLALLGLSFPNSTKVSSHQKPTNSVGANRDETIVSIETSTSNDEEEDEEDEDFANENMNRRNKIINFKTGWLFISICSFLYLGICCSLMLYDFAKYMENLWGDKTEALHLVSYFTFLFQVMVIPFWCLYARTLFHTSNEGFHRGYPLYRGYLERSVAILRNSRIGKKSLSCRCLIFFLAWPLANASLRIANDHLLANCTSWWTVSKEMGHWNALLGYTFYGCFCYIIYIERLSFQCEVRQISRFALEQASAKNVDAVRSRIRLFYAHYNVLRKQIGKWMAFTMVVATWGLTAHLTWNYLIFSDKKENFHQDIYFLNILVTSQKIMFFVVPCVALGGLNLEHVWNRFKYNIAKNREHKHEAYWSAIGRYVYEINVGFAGDLSPTLIFSAVGFYLGLHLGNGDQEYMKWNYPLICNGTN